jgi:hypothetical protein
MTGAPLTCGDRVRLTCAGRSVVATVLAASENQRSLIFAFEAVLAGHVGMMPVAGEGDPPRYSTLIGDQPVTISPIGGSDA